MIDFDHGFDRLHLYNNLFFRLGGPTSWRGSGVLGGVKFSFSEMKILQSSLHLVKSLDAQGKNVGWKQCGSLHLARTNQRLTHFRKMKAIAE